MPKELTMQALTNTFTIAAEQGATFVAIAVTVPGSDRVEILINHRESFTTKLAYYAKTYKENLEHVAAPLRIVGHTYAHTFAQIQDDFRHFYGV